MLGIVKRVRNGPRALCHSSTRRTAIVILLAVCPVVASGQTLDVKKSVKYCVEVVHKVKSANKFDDEFYKDFDAFYDPTSGEVQNNAYRNGDRDPLYRFNKCMTERGFSLTGARLKNQNTSSQSSSITTYLMREPVTMMDWGLRDLRDYIRDNLAYVEELREKVEKACSKKDNNFCEMEKKSTGLDRYDLSFQQRGIMYSFDKNRIIINISVATNETDTDSLKDIISSEQCKKSLNFIKRELGHVQGNEQSDVYIENLLGNLFSHNGFRKADEPGQLGSKIAEITYVNPTLYSSWNGASVDCSSGIL